MEHRIPEILSIIHGLNNYHRNAYCFPSQDKMLDLLNKRFRVVISRRMLNYDLKYLQDHGYIKRIRRHVSRPGQGWVMRSTLYKILIPGYLLLRRLGLNVTSALKRLGVGIKKAASRVFQDNRFSGEEVSFRDYLKRTRLGPVTS